ncbi:Rrf2 family transcriptional regulator [Dactylosporangium salmoneum]|uniref:Rrf2 family transcriptional regulator n=1 Tax=Dactylosporangium salmoneum TaxID=53361 RepID=A0ABN3FVB6_9ACTN
MSGGVEWALHCCVALTVARSPASAARLAEMHDVSASYLAKQLQSLARAGLVHSVQGHAGGYELTRDPALITVLDVVEAVDGARPAFTCTEVRQRGPLAAAPERCLSPCSIHAAMTAADEAWRAALRGVSIADLTRNVTVKTGPDTLRRIADWLG